MGGRSRRTGRLPLPFILPTLPLLLLLLLPLPAESYEDQVGSLSHFPSDALERLETRSVSLPPTAFQFDDITNGSQRYPDHMRYRTLTGTSLCKCRNRCLTETRCLGFEHEASSGTCGLTDILLKADITQETRGDWSTGRRQGISWLGQPCHEDSDCALFVSDKSGVECHLNKTCSCREGWTRETELLCRPDLETSSSTPATAETSHPTTERTTPPGIENTYTDASGRLFRLTNDELYSTKAAGGCLELGGVQYVPDSKQVVNDLYAALEIGSDEKIGAGFNYKRAEERYETADGSDLRATDLWTDNQLDGSQLDGCGGLLDKKLNDFNCYRSMKHVCEYIGPNLLEGLDASYSTDDNGTWWTYDMGEPKQISSVLYLAVWQPNYLERTKIYVGQSPNATSEGRSALCVQQDGKFLAKGFASRFNCPATLIGRYLRVRQIIRYDKDKLWEIMAAFGETG